MTVGPTSGTDGTARARGVPAQAGTPISPVRSIRPRREDVGLSPQAQEADGQAQTFTLLTGPDLPSGAPSATIGDWSAGSSPAMAFLAQSLAQESGADTSQSTASLLQAGIQAYARAESPATGISDGMDILPPGGPAFGTHHALDLAV